MVHQITENIFAIGKTIIKPDKQCSFIAYLITDKVNVLIDTLPLQLAKMLRQEIKKLLGNDKSEMIVYCTEECQERLSKQLDGNVCHLVESGFEVTLGENAFRFSKTPGLHWNDNMVTFLEKEKILFSNDLFGQLAACEPPVDSEYEEAYFM